MDNFLPEERGLSDIAATAPLVTPKRMAVAIGVVTVGVLLMINLVGGKRHAVDMPTEPAGGIGQVVPYEAARDEPPPLPMPSRQPFAPPPQVRQPPQAQIQPQPQPMAQQVLPTPQAPSVVAQKPKAHRMMSYDTPDPPQDAAHTSAGAGSGEASTAGTHVTFKPTPIAGAQAGAAIDKTLVLMPGLIRCILDVAVDSQMPGPLMCHLPDPVISDGNVVVMEAGSKIMGSYSSEVRQGQNRILAVSAVGYTPNGVPVPLGGPFADALGRSGLPGNVDNHLLERFGGAVLLTFVEGGLGITQAAVSKGGNSYVSLSSGGGVGGLAEEVLRSTINIPPTIIKHPGDEAYIWILEPIDFSKAYKLTNK